MFFIYLFIFFQAFFWPGSTTKSKARCHSHCVDEEAQAKEKGCWAVLRDAQGASREAQLAQTHVLSVPLSRG